MQKTNIEYLTHTWNPLAMRCTPVSEGCVKCWHLTIANRLAKNPMIPKNRQKAYAGGSPVLIEKELNAPLKLKKPAIIGVQFMGDLFHEDVPYSFILEIFKIIARAPQHTFILLTKRPDKAVEFYEYINQYKRIVTASRGFSLLHFWSLKNVWLGVTAENQKRADERIPILLQIPAAERFVSIEPMLGPVDFNAIPPFDLPGNDDLGTVTHYEAPWDEYLDWVIAGCESGPGRRSSKIEHFRSLRDQCIEASVPFFLKQLETNGKLVKMPSLDGKIWSETP